MKNKPATGTGNQPKAARKNTRKAVKISPHKLSVKRTSIKLRASTEKHVANRTRDKSTNPILAPISQKCLPGPSEKNKTGSNKVVATCKPKYLIQAKSARQLNHANKKAATVKNKGVLAAKANRNTKGNVKKKVIKQLNSDEFFDIWAFVSIGKREASLNASMKVNIMFEKYSPLKSGKTSPKKTETATHDSKQHGNITNKPFSKGKSATEGNSVLKNKKTPSDSAKELGCQKGKEGETSKEKSCQDHKLIPGKTHGKTTLLKSKNAPTESMKRKSPANKSCHDEPLAKTRKIDKKHPMKKKSKAAKTRKNLPSGHHLCNIIEKSPRQASLVAKAMIALEQEEDTVYESAARTQVYDWMELRSHTRNDSRRIRWCNGLGNSVRTKIAKNGDENLQVSTDEDTNVSDGVTNSESASNTTAEESESLHNTLLRTLHHIGDSRLLKEYFRAQKEDFSGSVDVEKCSTPEKPISCPDSKKIVVVEDEKVDNVGTFSGEKSSNSSVAKPQPCRVVTPIPQFPAGQRTSNVASFIHNPVTQPVYTQQHTHIHPQPIKVTPYPANPGYIYQYAVDSPQSKTYAPASSSPVLYGISSSDVARRDYTSPFTYNHMGRLGLDRGVSQYQPAAYNTPLHLPIQQIGFNYRPYYPATIHALPQQTMPALQSLPVHQQYPMVRAPVVTRQITQDVGQLGSYQHGYPSYSPLPSMRQTEGCMPPPIAPAHRRTPMGTSAPMRQQPLPSHTSLFSPMDSLKSFNPVGVQPIVSSSAVDFPPDFIHHPSNHHKQFAALPSYKPHHQQQFVSHSGKGSTNSVVNYSITCNEQNKSFSLCKKELEEVATSNCDLLTRSSVCSNECLSQSSGSSRASSECSDVSDLLHSAHSTMYQIEGVNPLDSMREFQQAQISVVSCDSSMRNLSPFKMSMSGHTSFSASYSVSSILDMPTCKIKTEPENKNSALSQPSDFLRITDQTTSEPPSTGRSILVCLASVGSSDESNSKESKSTTGHNMPQKSHTSEQSSITQTKVKTESGSGKSDTSFIIIDDTDGSSDDEPLARLVKSKSPDNLESQSTQTLASDSSHIKFDVAIEPKQSTVNIPTQPSLVKTEESNKQDSTAVQQIKLVPDSSKIKKHTKVLNPKHGSLKPQSERLSKENPSHPPVTEDEGKSQGDKESKKSSSSGKTSLGCSPKSKKPAGKMKTQPEWHLTSHGANSNHGWSWIGEGQMKPIPKVSLGREEPIRIRKCYKSMQHTSGEIVSVRDCVILHSDGDGKIPYVAKVSALWENLNGEMMFSMLWYYQPEHTAAGRDPEDGEQELFASKHREENSVACIDDKCFVLMYNEYCRLEAEGVRLEQGVTLPRWRELMPEVTAVDKELCRLPPPANTCADNIWFCRYDYDFRKKIVKKPKHKKSNLRYRVPCKMV